MTAVTLRIRVGSEAGDKQTQSCTAALPVMMQQPNVCLIYIPHVDSFLVTTLLSSSHPFYSVLSPFVSAPFHQSHNQCTKHMLANRHFYSLCLTLLFLLVCVLQPVVPAAFSQGWASSAAHHTLHG